MLPSKYNSIVFIATLLIFIGGISLVKAQSDCSASKDKWSLIGFQESSETILEIAVHPEQSSIVYVGTDANLYKSTDCGITWDTLQVDETNFSQVHFHHSQPDTVFVGANRILQSYDGGNNWTFIDQGIPYGSEGELRSLDVSSMDPQKIYAGVAFSDSTNLYRTTNGGANWMRLTDTVNARLTQNLSQVRMDKDHPDTAVVAIQDSGSVLYTWDGGSSLHKSPIFQTGKTIDDVTRFFNDFFVGVRNEAIYRLSEWDGSMRIDTLNIPDSIQVMNRLSAGYMGCGGGLYMSTNKGVFKSVLVICTSQQGNSEWEIDWNTKNEGLPHTFVNAMDVVDDSWLFVALQDTLGENGVFLRRMETITSIEGDKNLLPNQYSLHQNYPNPFNPSTNIQFSLPKASDVQLSIYNTIGQKVSTLVNQKMSGGSHSITFDASGLPSGVYIYRLKTDGFSESRKMLLLK